MPRVSFGGFLVKSTAIVTAKRPRLSPGIAAGSARVVRVVGTCEAPFDGVLTIKDYPALDPDCVDATSEQPVP